MKDKDRNVKQTLQKLASRLPFNYYECKTGASFYGSEILASNPDAKDAEGQPINAVLKYTVNIDTQRPVDHYRRLKRIYREKGWAGVEHYCKSAVSSIHEAMQEVPKTIGGIQTSFT